MTDFAGDRRLQPAATQLPVGGYVDPAVWALEARLIFDAGPRYIGHELMVPEPGDYRVPETLRGAEVLVRNGNGVEFCYPEEIACFEREFVEAQRAACMETAAEDREICERIQHGRKALWQQGRDEVGPCHSPDEDDMLHFHEFVQRQLHGR